MSDPIFIILRDEMFNFFLRWNIFLNFKIFLPFFKLVSNYKIRDFLTFTKLNEIEAKNEEKKLIGSTFIRSY